MVEIISEDGEDTESLEGDCPGILGDMAWCLCEVCWEDRDWSKQVMANELWTALVPHAE